MRHTPQYVFSMHFTLKIKITQLINFELNLTCTLCVGILSYISKKFVVNRKRKKKDYSLNFLFFMR